MKLLIILPVVLSSILFTGCDGIAEQQNKDAVLAAKLIVKNRNEHAKEIITATNDCIKAASSVQSLAAASNDQAEIVIACTESAQKAYGAYSDYQESWLATAATR